MAPATHEAIPHAVRVALDAAFRNENGIYTSSKSPGYWSNLDSDTQRQLLTALESGEFYQVVREKLPGLQAFIFGDARAAGLELLDIQPSHVGVDLGCMWGNLLVAAARRSRAMVGIDKTRDHLLFLQHRLRAEGAHNVALVNADLREDLGLNGLFDFAIVNGVLEWVPEDQNIALSGHFQTRRRQFVRPKVEPRTLQLEFLRRVARSLKPNGKLYLAIENRYDYQYFLWKREPHTRLWFAAVVPRSIANLFSNVVYGRPYVNYLYSEQALQQLLAEAGFARIDKYVAFPTYRHPHLILPLHREAAERFRPAYPDRPTANRLKTAFRKTRGALDNLIFRRLKCLNLAPAFIFVALNKSDDRS